MKKWTFVAYGGGDCIGGSHYTHNGTIGIDYGAIQSEKNIKYLETSKDELPLFVLSHDHLDHCGGMPLYAREHPESRVLMTETAFEGMQLQLRDSIKISSLRAEIDALRGLKPEPPAFDYQDIDNLALRAEFILDTSWFEPLPGHMMSFRSAGHKPGAAMFLIVFPDGTRVVHACDISLDEQALVRGAGIPKDFLNPDVLVVECTYGNREIPNRSMEEKRLVDTVRNVLARGGKIIIPHFASTLANIALPLAKAGFFTNIDGMGRSFTRLYADRTPWCEEDKPFRMEDFGSLFLVGGDSPRDAQFYREELVYQAAPAVIVSSSGMLEAGPSVFYVEELIGDSRNAIIIPGYQASKTQGRKLLQLEKGEQISFSHQVVKRGYRGRGRRLKEWTENRRIRADVLPFKLSGHSDGNKVARWICQLNPRRVVTVHGEPESHEGLRQRVRRLNKNIEVISSRNGEILEFSF